MKTIYNEGRVVGLSAYEIYVKQFVQDHPDEDPATEREWLASSLAMGNSMLLKLSNVTIPEGKDVGIIEIPLPQNSKLCAANTIIASFMFAEGLPIAPGTAVNSNYGSGTYFWYKEIHNLGQLIQNNSTNPKDGYIASDYLTSIPPQAKLGYPSEWAKLRLRGYMSIYDGVVIQPGNWKASETSANCKDFEPDLSKSPVVRLLYNQNFANATILLTGFSISTVVKGESGIEGSTGTEHPENGDFLGPQAYPWANKIIFSIPSEVCNYFLNNNFERSLPQTDTNSARLKELSLIDSKASEAKEYYKTHQGSVIVENVKELNSLTGEYTVTEYNEGDPIPLPKDQKPGANILTLYSRRGASAPSALYESVVLVPDTLIVNNKDGSQNVTQRNQDVNLYPVDVVAPGTVKLFHGDTDSNRQKIRELEENEPENYGLLRTNDYILLQYNGTDYLPIVDVETTQSTISYISSSGSQATGQYYQNKVTTGNKSVKSISTVDKSGNALELDGNIVASVGVGADTSYLTWKHLLAALGNNLKLDVIGDVLRKFWKHTIRSESASTPYNSNSNGKFSIDANVEGNVIGSKQNYIVLGTGANAVRLYISKDVPTDTDIPVGSIGIGWGIK
mgnify:CR=1 FL=1